MYDFTTDIRGMLDTEAFGTLVTLPDASTITGILDIEQYDIDTGQTYISTTNVVLLCQSDDVSTITQGSTVTVEGTTYTVDDINDDGTGVTELTLKK